VFAVVPRFVSGWRAFSSVSLCDKLSFNLGCALKKRRGALLWRENAAPLQERRKLSPCRAAAATPWRAKDYFQVIHLEIEGSVCFRGLSSLARHGQPLSAKPDAQSTPRETAQRLSVKETSMPDTARKIADQALPRVTASFLRHHVCVAPRHVVTTATCNSHTRRQAH
jgi:hypothetical protein